jgi:plasmid stabilization system protein ParE
VTYRFLGPARADFDDAVDWYDAQQPPLGDDFIAEVYATVQRMVAAPQSFPRAGRVAGGREVRLAPVHRYPYLVYYEVTATELLILCVVHEKRRWHPWRHRLP